MLLGGEPGGDVLKLKQFSLQVLLLLAVGSDLISGQAMRERSPEKRVVEAGQWAVRLSQTG